MNLLNSFKKGLATVTLAALSLVIMPSTFAASLGFTDDAEVPSWAEEAIGELMDQGVFTGNDDGSFAPTRQLNRAEVAKVIVLASGVEFDTYGGAHFPDVQQGDWFYDYVETMYNYGWIDGYPDGYFRPGNGINRAEIAKMVINAFEIEPDMTGAPHFDDVSDADWFFSYVETAYNYGLMRGFSDGTFGPAKPVNRAETATIVYEGQLVVLPAMGAAEGTLEVILSEETPRGTNVPFNATSVPYTTLELTASDDSDVEISSLTMTRLGLGDNDDFDSVWLEIDGFKVGNDKSINNDDIVELRFNPPIVIPAGQTLLADVVASAKYTSTDKNVGHHNRLALVAADDIASTAANVVGDFPVEGEEMEVADYEVSEIQFSGLGSDTTVDVGDNFIEIGKFRMLNSSNTNKDIELRALTFKNDGTAEIEDILENVAMYVSGEQVSAETIIDGDYITFRLDNGVTGGYVIEDGDSRIFSIRADIVSAESGDNINFKVDNYEDVVAIEIGTSFGVKTIAGNSGRSFADGSTTDLTGSDVCTTASSAEDNCARLRAYKIDAGDLNVSRDPASLGNQQYAPGSNDVVVLTARIVVDQPLLVDGVTLNVAAGTELWDGETTPGEITDDLLAFTALNEQFDNFRLFLNDKLVDSENDFTGEQVDGTTDNDGKATDAKLVFDTTFEIAGASIMKLVANVQDGANNGSKLKVTLDATNFVSPEYISTGDQISSTRLLGSAQGSFVEIASSTIDINRTDGLSSGDKIVAGVDDVTFMKFVLDNNDSGDVNITSVTVRATATGQARTISNFTAAIFVDGTQQGSSKNFTAITTVGANGENLGEATFNDLSVIIPSAGQKEFTVVVNTIEESGNVVTEVAGAGDGTENSNNDSDIQVVNATAAKLNVGDTLYLVSVDGTTVDTTRVIASIGAADAPTAGYTLITFNNAVDFTGNTLVGGTVTLKHTIQLDITAVDADNVENGQQVTVNEGGTTLTVANPAAGIEFELIESGTLTVEVGTTVYSDLIVANATDVEVAKIRLRAADDEIQVKDLYFINDHGTEFGDRVDFKLYNEAGQLVQEKQMTGGTLHFELANQDRISVPKNGSTTITLKIDARQIDQANQTGKRLKLALDTVLTTKGIEALTAATGSDIATPVLGWGDAVGEEFILYASELSVKHSASQPNFQDPSTLKQEAYRFNVTADAAGEVELGRLSFSLAVQGMERVGNFAAGDFLVQQVKSDGTLDDTANVATVTSVSAASTTGAVLAVDFINQKLNAGETRMYSILMLNTTNPVGGVADDDSVSVTIVRDDISLGFVGPAARATQVAAPGLGALASTLAGTDTTLVGAAGTFSALHAGDDVTYAVGTGTCAAGNYVVDTVNADGSVVTIATSMGTACATAATDTVTLVADAVVPYMVWSDEASSSHSDTTLDWHRGYFVDIDSATQVNAD